MKKKYFILIILILVLILGIFAFVNITIDGESPSTNMFSKKSYKKYKAGDLVNFNNSEWYVMYDSSSNEDFVTLISGNIISLEDKGINTIPEIYESSELNKFLSEDFIESLGKENFIAKNGYKARLFNQDDFDNLLNTKYNEELDQYEIIDCPSYICVTNNYFTTMIDTDSSYKSNGVINDINEIEDPLYDEYTLHLKYYNITSTYEEHVLNSLVDSTSLNVRPVINIYKGSIK